MKDLEYLEKNGLELNSIYNIDCFIGMKYIEDHSVDIILCDLPYGTTSNKWDSILPLDELWKEYIRILKPTGVVALTASQPFTSKLVLSNLKMFKHEWIWQKNRGSNFANTVREPFKEHESVLIFSAGKWTYNKQMQPRSEKGLSRSKYKFNLNSKSENYREFEGRVKDSQPEMRVPSSIQKFNVEVGLHPTQKPTELFKYILKTYSNEGDIVMDNCIGSGTTAIAALSLNRKFIGFEKEEKYYNISIDRINNIKT
jgi:site-specific DNA-methyltransferase (adenine-specific)